MPQDRGVRKSSPVRAAVLCALLAMQPLTALAQPVGARYQVDQPAQPLSEALKAIASQTSTSVLFDPAVVGKRLSKAVTGQFTGAEAIAKALEGSGLIAEVMRDGSVVVKQSPSPSTETPSGQSPNGLAPPIHFAQGPAPGPSTTDAGTDKPENQRERAQKLPTVEVTGSRIKRVELDAAFPVNVYTREDIDRSGQASVTGFLGGLNEVSVRRSEGASGASSTLGTVQLRGLPIGTTLVLINGRRVQPIGGSLSLSVFDLDLIPLAALDRIEILPVGSSAIYGGDALGGAINFILKNSSDGIHVTAVHGSAKGTSDTSFALATGASGDRGSVLLLTGYNKTNPLYARERDFFVDADYRRFGGPDGRTRSCTPGTVTNATAGNLPGLSSSFAGIPSGAPGQTLAVADFVPTAGQANLCNVFTNGKGATLVDAREAASLHAAGEYRLRTSVTAFGELTYVDSRSSGSERGLALSNVLVPATNAYNPFGSAVRVTARLGLENGVAGGGEKSFSYARAVLGAKGQLSGTWEYEAATLVSRDDTPTVFQNEVVNTAALNAALASSNPATALNPFATGRAATDEVLRSIWSDAPVTGRGEKNMTTAFARGTAASLPAGALDVITGVEWARDELENASPTRGIARATARESNAVFAEARVPLLAARDQVRGFELATLTLAGRRDHYSDIGTANTHQAGFELRPVRSALVRLSTATSFKPPSLLQLTTPPQNFPTEAFLLVDPARNNEPIVGGQVSVGPNPDLDPERGRANVLGIVWEPDIPGGMRFAVNRWDIALENFIVFLDPQTALNNESGFPGLVIRGPSSGGAAGPVTQVLSRNVNFGKVDVAGTDWELAYQFRTAVGSWRLSGAATKTSKYIVELQPGAAAQDRLGKRHLEAWAPKWKGRLSLNLDRKPWGAGVTGRYVGKYQDTPPLTRELGDNWTIDLFASIDLKSTFRSLTSGVKSASVSSAVINVTDRLPEFAGNTSPFYDSTQADWRGRYVSVRLSVGW